MTYRRGLVGRSRPCAMDRPLDGVVVNLDEARAHRAALALHRAHDLHVALVAGCALCVAIEEHALTVEVVAIRRVAGY